MKQTCQTCRRIFEVDEWEQSFLSRMLFRFGSRNVSLPPPQSCPDCRLQCRVAHRNEFNLYFRTSDFSGRRIVSMYPEEAPWGDPYKVYSTEEWHGDDWNPLNYGRDFDFSRPFFDQFMELHKSVPRISLIGVANENSPFANCSGFCKNCYLVTSTDNCEECYYGKLLQRCKSCVDCSYVYDCELCYEGFSLLRCYGCRYVSYSRDSSECWFSEGLAGCKSCLFCSNLCQASYCIFNKQVKKEEFENRLREILASHEFVVNARKEWRDLSQERVRRFANIEQSEGCSGDFISNSKNCLKSYDLNGAEDCGYVSVGVSIRDCLDCSNIYLGAELNYQLLGVVGSYNCAFSNYVINCRDVLYSEYLFNCQNVFGCEGLKRKNYCVLNKEYRESDYNDLVFRIIEHMKGTGEWGTFFPVKSSAHSYNESLAFDYFPLSKEEVLSRGWSWREPQQKDLPAITMSSLPDATSEIPSTVVEEILACRKCGSAYRIIPQEFDFYKINMLPIPRLCPRDRHRARESLRPARALYSRACGNCGEPILSPYAPTAPEVIYCGACYTREVF